MEIEVKNISPATVLEVESVAVNIIDNVNTIGLNLDSIVSEANGIEQLPNSKGVNVEQARQALRSLSDSIKSCTEELINLCSQIPAAFASIALILSDTENNIDSELLSIYLKLIRSGRFTPEELEILKKEIGTEEIDIAKLSEFIKKGLEKKIGNDEISKDTYNLSKKLIIGIAKEIAGSELVEKYGVDFLSEMIFESSIEGSTNSAIKTLLKDIIINPAAEASYFVYIKSLVKVYDKIGQNENLTLALNKAFDSAQKEQIIRFADDILPSVFGEFFVPIAVSTGFTIAFKGKDITLTDVGEAALLSTESTILSYFLKTAGLSSVPLLLSTLPIDYAFANSVSQKFSEIKLNEEVSAYINEDLSKYETENILQGIITLDGVPKGTTIYDAIDKMRESSFPQEYIDMISGNIESLYNSDGKLTDRAAAVYSVVSGDYSHIPTNPGSDYFSAVEDMNRMINDTSSEYHNYYVAIKEYCDTRNNFININNY